MFLFFLIFYKDFLMEHISSLIFWRLSFNYYPKIKKEGQNNCVSSNLYFGLERQQQKQHIKHEPTRDHFLMILKQRLWALI